MAKTMTSSALDLTFTMDCTGSMGSYIASATNNIRSIVDEVVSKEMCDIRLALIEYRDHPPQDNTFVTRVHPFTNEVNVMKQWLSQCTAQGGGDGPEAVADAMNDSLHLSWRSNATKVCILISDAPPHGLKQCSDGFPDGCPLGHDPLKIARQMADAGITLYVVGVEPPIVPFREFFMSLAHITGGQYVPMNDANRLAMMITSGVREEISINQVIQTHKKDINEVIRRSRKDGISDQETAERLQTTLSSRNVVVNSMQNKNGVASKRAQEVYANCADMSSMQSVYQKSQAPDTATPSTTDYELQERQSITIEQSSRIVQKLKSSTILDDEPQQRQLRTQHTTIPCKHGADCYDYSERHRNSYTHPSGNKTNNEKTACRYGAKCYDHTPAHRQKFQHPENDESVDTRSDGKIQCRHGVRCHDFTSHHRAKYTHP